MPADRTIHEAYRPVDRLLDSLRRRIRTYVLLEAGLMALVVVGLVFWAGLALDWTFEPPTQVRSAVLLLVLAAVVGIVMWWGLRRWMVVLSDRSLALSIERQHPELSDVLSSAVDLQAKKLTPDQVHPELAMRTVNLAADAAAGLDCDELLNQWRLNRFALAVGALALSIIGLAMFVPRVWQTYTDRLALSPDPWPRTVQLSIAGFQPDGQGGFVRKVPRNSDVPVVVHARLDGGLQVPDRVTIRYRWQEGRRGRDDLVRIGDAVAGRDESQRFEYLFERIASDVEFDIRGGDDRLRRYRLEVVERPKVTNLTFACKYPDYLQRSERQIAVGPQVELPEGTRLVVRGQTNKPLSEVHWQLVEQSDDTAVRSTTVTQAFETELELAADDMELGIELTDTDGIASADPFRVAISSRRDLKPQVLVARQGIGTAVTSNARLPIEVSIEDDYGVDQVWLDISRDGSALSPQAVRNAGGDRRDVVTLAMIDLAELATAEGAEATQAFAPGQHLTVVAAANDHYDLTPDSRTAEARPLTFEIVTEDELMARLAGDEQNLRQTFESVADKLLQLYDSLEQLDSVAAEVNDTADEDESLTDADSEAPQGRLARESLRLAETARQIGAEVLGVGGGFEDIHAQLTNNRIENTELSERIGNRIAAPLRQLGSEQMPQVANSIAAIADDASAGHLAKQETRRAIQTVEQLLREMQGLENYNEVVAMLRDIIKQQDQINTKTKEQQKSELRNLLLD